LRSTSAPDRASSNTSRASCSQKVSTKHHAARHDQQEAGAGMGGLWA
jgi:hypothetical protein